MGLPHPSNVILAAVASALTVGCPQLLKDDYSIDSMSPLTPSGATGIGGAANSIHPNAGAKSIGAASSSGGFEELAGTGGSSLMADGGSAGVGSFPVGWGGNSLGDAGAGGMGASGEANTGAGGESGGVGGTSEVGGVGGTSEVGGVGGTSEVGGVGGTSEVGGVGGTSEVGGGNCVLGPFQPPIQITGLNTTGEIWGPTLSADAFTLYFSTWDGTTDRIFRATRQDRGGEFSAAVSVETLRSGAAQATPFLTFDGLSLYFVSTRSGGSDRDIWFSQRSNENSPFSAAQAVPMVNSGSADVRPWVSRDELTMLFASDRSKGKGDLDIWIATRASRSQDFSEPIDLPVINTMSKDESPVLSADGLTLYFASNRNSNADDRDIYSATRADLDSDFGSVTTLTVVNSAKADLDLALTHDDREMFFISNRSGTPLLYRTTRDCE